MSWGLLGLLPIHLGKSRTRALRTLSILSRKTAGQTVQQNQENCHPRAKFRVLAGLGRARVLPWLSRDSIKA